MRFAYTTRDIHNVHYSLRLRKSIRAKWIFIDAEAFNEANRHYYTLDNNSKNNGNNSSSNDYDDFDHQNARRREHLVFVTTAATRTVFVFVLLPSDVDGKTIRGEGRL